MSHIVFSKRLRLQFHSNGMSMPPHPQSSHYNGYSFFNVVNIGGKYLQPSQNQTCGSRVLRAFYTESGRAWCMPRSSKQSPRRLWQGRYDTAHAGRLLQHGALVIGANITQAIPEAVATPPPTISANTPSINPIHRQYHNMNRNSFQNTLRRCLNSL